jgi:hydrogenase maturation protease
VSPPENFAVTVAAAPVHHVLIAGVGNIFLRDDGFGVEVTRRLAAEALPDWVRVVDFGIRGVHLAYEMLDGGYDTTIMVDATPRGEKPGTVYLIEPDLKNFDGQQPASFDAHGMDPQLVFSTLKSFGGVPGRVLIVGCEPLDSDEGIGLSEPVQRGVGEAVRLLHSVVEDLVCACAVTGEGIDR